MSSVSIRLPLLAFSLLVALALHAQDTRTVTEPKIPPACITLRADVAANQGVIALADEQKLSTTRIQDALNQCAAAPDIQSSSPFSRSVVLRSKGKRNVFLTGPLTLRPGVVLVVSKNTALVASRDPRVYDLSPGSCGIVSEHGRGCKPLITGDGAANAGIMGEGSIDARGGATLLGQDVTWWDLAHQAKVSDQQQSVPAMISLRHVDNFILYEITLRNSPGFHVAINQTDGFTAWGVKIMTPKTARNTDGIDPGSSRNITIAYSYIHTGDDDVCLKPSAAGPVSNMSVLHNHFYSGHGMSIGSGTYGGVDHLLVDDLTIDGADNGLRIKSDPSRGGLVHQVLYRNVCIRNVPNPLVFTPHYTNFTGDRLPIYQDITLQNVHVLTPGAFTFLGLDADHKLQIKLDNVFADDQKDSLFYDKDADITLGPSLGDLEPKGDDVAITQAPGSSPGQSARLATLVSFPFLKTKQLLKWPVKFPPKTKPFTSPPTAPATTTPSSARSTWLPKPAARSYRSRPASIAKCSLSTSPTSPFAAPIPTPAKPSSSTIAAPARTEALFTPPPSTSPPTTSSPKTSPSRTTSIALTSKLPQGAQALALLVTGDRAIFHNVHLLGNQDTVYLGSRGCTQNTPGCAPTRQYFSDCYVEGNVDFIFGDSKAVFENCEIHSTPHDGGFITAQSKHYPDEDSGFVIDHSKLTADPGVVGNVFLGRPWRAYSTVIFMHTWMDDKIAPAGWSEWHAEQTHMLDTTYYAEFDSSGPGAHHDQRDPHTHFLTPEEAKQYEPSIFLRGADNWNPLQLPVPAAQ